MLEEITLVHRYQLQLALAERLLTRILKNQQKIVNRAIQYKYKHLEEAKDFEFEFDTSHLDNTPYHMKI